MGLLTQAGTGRAFPLVHHMLIGRSRESDLLLDQSVVSGEHAVVMWDRSGWAIKDLASRNGTYLDGTLLTAGAWTPIRQGAQLSFGGDGELWVVESADPPDVVAMKLSETGSQSEEALCGEHGSLVFPDGTQLGTEDGQRYWVLRGDSRKPVENREVVQLGDARWRLLLPDTAEPLQPTQTAEPSSATERMTIHFDVSADEEHVQISLSQGSRSTPLRSRSFDYMLLYLARARLADGPDEPGSAADKGWVYTDEAAEALGVDVPHLNVDVFRARRRFAMAGVQDATSAIERRTTTRQIRLGFSRIVIVRGGTNEGSQEL